MNGKEYAVWHKIWVEERNPCSYPVPYGTELHAVE